MISSISHGGRRAFLQSAVGLLAGGAWTGKTIAAAPRNVNPHSKPSDLKITDLRVANLGIIALIRIDTNQGIYGLGETYTGSSKTYPLFLKSRLLGENPCNVDRLFRKIKQFGFHGRQASGVTAVEMALWDLRGKREDRPLRELLGGVRDKVEVGVSVGLQPSPAALVKTVGQYLASGYGRIKIKIKPGRDVADAEAVRKAFPHIRLQVDANSAYTLETAQTIRLLDSLDLLLIEQPLAEDDLWEHAKLQKQFRAPICLDESILSPLHARSALEMGACKIVNIKPGRVGGLSQAIAIHDLCRAQGVPVWCGGMLETGVGRAANLAVASLPGFTLPGDISASDRYYVQDVTCERFALNPDSTIDVPVAPGLGVTVDGAALKKFALAKLRLKTP